MMTTTELQQKVRACFKEHFGETPLKRRLKDILDECLEVYRAPDNAHLEEELGDLLAAAIMCAEEQGWSAEELVLATLDKIYGRSDQYKSLGRKINIALLGGAFNPVTLGHIDLAQYVLDTTDKFDEVWLMPCHEHMYGKEMASYADRLAMVEMACGFDGRIKPFNYEIRIKHTGSTYELVQKLLAEEMAKNTYTFHFIIGMDNANEFYEKWANPAELERLIPFVIVPRQGYERNSEVDWYLKPPHIYLGSSERQIMESDSTMVRELTKQTYVGAEEQLAALINPDVLRYMKTQKLYGYAYA